MSELKWCGYCKSWHSKPCGEGCCWSPTDPTLDEMLTAALIKRTTPPDDLPAVVGNSASGGKVKIIFAHCTPVTVVSRTYRETDVWSRLQRGVE
jgi:hypothetical protein